MLCTILYDTVYRQCFETNKGKVIRPLNQNLNHISLALFMYFNKFQIRTIRKVLQYSKVHYCTVSYTVILIIIAFSTVYHNMKSVYIISSSLLRRPEDFFCSLFLWMSEAEQRSALCDTFKLTQIVCLYTARKYSIYSTVLVPSVTGPVSDDEFETLSSLIRRCATATVLCIIYHGAAGPAAIEMDGVGHHAIT